MKLRFRQLHRTLKLTLWITALIVTGLVSSFITWHVNAGLEAGSKTKIFDYAYIEKSDSEHRTSGEAECWNGVGSRADIYKCTQKNSIYAPCFRDDISNDVKCPLNPKTNQGSKYFTAKFMDWSVPLMDTYGKEPTPWYMYLDSGEECSYLYGATTTVANKRLDFGCKDSPLTLYLPTKEENGVLTISCMKDGHLEDCRVQEMWR